MKAKPMIQQNQNSNVRVTTETITPEKAKKLLSNVNNVRTPLRPHVVTLARAMRDNKWEMNGNPIKINASGQLIDGEHRLRACLESNSPFRTLVAYGIESCNTIDTAYRARTAGQILGKAGTKNAVGVGSAATLLWMHQNVGFENLAGKFVRPAIAEIVEVVNANPGLTDSTIEALKVNRQSRIPAPPLALIHFLSMQKYREKVEPFLTEITFGAGLQRGSASYALRERFVRTSKTNRIDYFPAVALVFKAWNSYVNGENIYQLRWQGIQEKVQTPIH